MKHGKIRRVVRPWLCDTASSSCVQAAGSCPFHRPCSPPAESTKGGFTPVFLGLWSQKEEMLTLMAPESGQRRGAGGDLDRNLVTGRNYFICSLRSCS